jgi:Protein of unknown function (DUF2891)
MSGPHRSAAPPCLRSPIGTADPPRFDGGMLAAFRVFPLLLLAAGTFAQDPTAMPTFAQPAAERFAELALGCVDREYPNKISHSLASDADVAPPRTLTPIFFGCYDWHSSVHGHWLLVRLLRQFPQLPQAGRIRTVLATHFTAERAAAEAKYLNAADRAPFERPYGLAWLLQLTAELRGFDDADARAWTKTLAPLETTAAQRLRQWLPKLSHPIRTGEHSQSAFAMGLIRDWAVAAGDREMIALIDARARTFHLDDPAWNLRFEPSGQDFLSPGLAEADLMRRVLPPAEFATWLQRFLPELPRRDGAGWLLPAVVTDKSDGKLAHLDGLNLSRAWMLEGIHQGLPADDPRRPALLAAAATHRAAGLASVTGEHYEGGHWLGSFAVYLVSGRGLRP